MAIIGSIIAAYKFGSMIADNLLQTLPTSVPFYVMLILMALQLCFSVTVASSAMFLQIENYFKLPECKSCKKSKYCLKSVGTDFHLITYLSNLVNDHLI